MSTAITFLRTQFTNHLMSMINRSFGFGGACIFLTVAGLISLLFIRNFPSEPSIVKQQKTEVHWRYYIALLITIILIILGRYNLGICGKSRRQQVWIGY